MNHLGLLSLFATAVTLAGCVGGQRPADQTVYELAQLVYPADAGAGADLDIVARVKGGALLVNNRTPRVYENAQLWINQQYVGIVPRLAIGADDAANKLSLRQFINRHGESFPVGGFLTPDKNRPVLLLEMFLPDESGQLIRHRLLVQRGKS